MDRLIEFAVASQKIGEEWGPVTQRLYRTILREASIYERNRERLFDAHAVTFTASAVVGLFGDADRANRLARGLTTTEVDLNLTQLRNSLFLFGSSRHVSAPHSKPRLTDSTGHYFGGRPVARRRIWQGYIRRRLGSRALDLLRALRIGSRYKVQ